jgi:hypothetical protein
MGFDALICTGMGLLILVCVVKSVLSAVRFWWMASAGNRLRPWRSEYLCWRVETYTGKPAGSLGARDFLRLLFSERHQMLRFFAWAGELNERAHGKLVEGRRS